MSFTCIRKSRGPRTEFCGAPDVASSVLDFTPLKTMHSLLFYKTFSSQQKASVSILTINFLTKHFPANKEHPGQF